MNKLNFISKKNGEVLDSREWNLLVSFINTLIDFYNEFPETVSSFDNDSGYLTLKDIAEYATKGDVASAIQTLINSGGITGPQGEPGLVPYIDNVTKHWMIGDVDTGIISEGKNGANGITPHIDSTTKHWMIGNIDTGIVAEGQNGANGADGINGTNGTDGITPHIDPTSKHWMIGETDTGIVAEGLDGTNGQNGSNGTNGSNGITPHIDPTTGNWFIGETNTGVSAQGPAGNNGSDGNDGVTPHIDSTTGNWFIGNTDTGVHAQGPAGQDGTAVGQLQADWNLSDDTQPDYIKNKPLKMISESTNGHDYVEIGGILWATMNVGANTVTDAGLYFQWGDTQGYTKQQIIQGVHGFNYIDYKFCSSGTNVHTDEYITKYNNVDNKRILDIEDDAARANWGGSWRIPTVEEFQQLYAATTKTHTNDYQGSGVSGTVFTTTDGSGAELFFPSVGFAANNTIEENGTAYYSSCIRNENTIQWTDCIYPSTDYPVALHRSNGFPVRAVIDESVTPTLRRISFTGNYNDLSNKPSLNNYVQKSLTAGLLKNDGTVDTNTYLTQHQSLNGYLTSSDITGMVTSSTQGLKIEVVAALPASPDANTLYIVQ